MQDLYKGFRKIAEDEKSATLEHEQGHKLNIAKHGLSKKQKAALKKLPLYQAEGTQVPEEKVAQQEMPDAGEQAKQVGVSIADAVAEKILEGATQSTTPRMVDSLPQAPQPELGVHEAPAPMPTAPMMPQPEIPPNQPAITPTEKENLAQYVQEQQAPKEELQVPVEEPQAQPEMPAAMPAPKPPRQLKPLTDEEVIASSRTTASQKMAAYNNMILKTMRERQELRQKFEQDIKDKRIEPKQMYGEDTGKNILTVISLLLGGMAGGVLRQENPALKMINEEIERDIQRQKENIATEQNLYKYNLDMLGDDIDAYTQSVNQMRQIALTQMEEMMGKIYDPSNPMSNLQMQAEAAKLRAEIDRADAAVAERKQREKLLQALESSGGVSKMDPASIARILVSDSGDQAKVFEEIKDRQTIAKTMPQIFKLFDQANVENTALRTGTVPYVGRLFKKPDSVAALETLLTPLIKTQGPAREAEMKRIFDSIIPGPYDDAEDVVTKRNALNNYIAAVSQSPVSNAYGLNLEKFETTRFTDPSDARKNRLLEYARQNINSTDPEIRKEAEFVLRKYGAQ